jgi:hypothetical protein
MHVFLCFDDSFRRCIQSLPEIGEILKDEVRYTGTVISQTQLLYSIDDWCHRNPKNYQVWFHRRWLIEQLVAQRVIDQDELHAAELERVSELIDQEPKHYNAWSHKLFLAELFNTFQSNIELEFAGKYINLDVRNNSAWSYRRHCISRREDFLFSSEISFVLNHITKAPSNESPWVYLRSLPNWHSHDEVEKLCDQILTTSDSSAFRHVIDTLAVLYEKTGRPGKAIGLRNKLAETDLNRQAFLKYRNSLVVS